MPQTLVISPIDDSLPGHVIDALLLLLNQSESRHTHARESQRSRAYITGTSGQNWTGWWGHLIDMRMVAWVSWSSPGPSSPIRHCTNIADRYQSQLTKCSNMADSLINEHCYLWSPAAVLTLPGESGCYLSNPHRSVTQSIDQGLGREGGRSVGRWYRTLLSELVPVQRTSLGPHTSSLTSLPVIE